MIRKPGDLPERSRTLPSSERGERFYVVHKTPGPRPGLFVAGPSMFQSGSWTKRRDEEVRKND